MAKPTVVFVPGGFHTPAIFDPVLPFLHAAGYPTASVYLPSVGVSPGIPDLSPDVEAVNLVVGGLVGLGREVLLVAHSYGGVPSSEGLQGLSKQERQAQGLAGGVVSMLFVSAHLPQKGKSAIESMNDCSPEEKESPSIIKTAPSEDPTALLPENPIEAFYHDLDPAVAKYYASLLRRQSVGPFLSQITHESYRQIPTSCLLLSNDRAVSLARQKRVAKNAGIQQLLGPINCGHSPFLSHPEEVSKFIRQVAGET
ncbi:hypothetical protein I7I53_00531 [Histoplasma capsulatum var. duboisii H88]|uniref:AB hydrolase-1 domain-containing protein n=1 Tax=Ajellomyces capsulatus (strain H88) TaxID=544711 RepID=A0A8A1LMS8_AJEC8|nr:hypothetical protein I7I53_00531 [Histoplasma capsulatum var. duboisii H88]